MNEPTFNLEEKIRCRYFATSVARSFSTVVHSGSMRDMELESRQLRSNAGR